MYSIKKAIGIKVEESAALYSRLMSTIVGALSDFHGFFPYHNTSIGLPSGTSNVIAGLAPLRLFLDIAGIRLFSPNRVALWRCSPFPWPIEIQWQGLSLRKEGTHSQITFPDSTHFETDSTEAVMITP